MPTLALWLRLSMNCWSLCLPPVLFVTAFWFFGISELWFRVCAETVCGFCVFRFWESAVFSIWCICVIYKAVRDGGRAAVSRFLNGANHDDRLSESDWRYDAPPAALRREAAPGGWNGQKNTADAFFLFILNGILTYVLCTKIFFLNKHLNPTKRRFFHLLSGNHSHCGL